MAYTAHVLFEEQSDLGVMYSGFRGNEFITVPQGTTLDLTIYNGNKENEIEVKFVYAGAIKMQSALTFLTVSLVSLYLH